MRKQLSRKINLNFNHRIGKFILFFRKEKAWWLKKWNKKEKETNQQAESVLVWRIENCHFKLEQGRYYLGQHSKTRQLNSRISWTATGTHACSSPPRIAIHFWMYQLQRVTQQFVLTSPFSFNFHAPQFHFEGLNFSFCCYVLCAASEVVKGHLDLPLPLAGRLEALYCWCIWIGLFPVAVSLLFLCTSTAYPGPTVFRQSSAMCSTSWYNTSSAHGPWGELRCVSFSEQVLGVGEASGWALLF